MNIRIAGIADDSIVDGPGLRLTVFAQGCPHRLPRLPQPAVATTFRAGRRPTRRRSSRACATTAFWTA